MYAGTAAGDPQVHRRRRELDARRARPLRHGDRDRPGVPGGALRRNAPRRDEDRQLRRLVEGASARGPRPRLPPPDLRKPATGPDGAPLPSLPIKPRAGAPAKPASAAPAPRHATTNSVSANRASGSIHCSWQRKPAPRPSRRSRPPRTCRSSPSRSARPRRTRPSQSARGMRTVCGARDTRCISTRRSPAFQTARCAKAARSKSARSSRVDPHEQVLVEGRRHAERIVVGEQQVPLRLDEIGAEQQRVARAQRAADLARGTPARPDGRSCRCSSRERARASRPRRRGRAAACRRPSS